MPKYARQIRSISTYLHSGDCTSCSRNLLRDPSCKRKLSVCFSKPSRRKSLVQGKKAQDAWLQFPHLCGVGGGGGGALRECFWKMFFLHPLVSAQWLCSVAARAAPCETISMIQPYRSFTIVGLGHQGQDQGRAGVLAAHRGAWGLAFEVRQAQKGLGWAS